VETRRLGRLEHRSSVLIYGAASLGAVDQDTADASVAEALDAGINHLDVAADYGDAELRLGPMMGEIRDRVFLATKTGLRTEEEAWAQINRSLERLQTDHVDLIQLHAVCTPADLDLVTGEAGSLRAAVRAKEEGLARAIGLTGHTHAAPSVHLEGLRRFPFDTILTPLNHRLFAVPGYAEDYRALVAAVQAADAGLMTIKMIARRPWPSEDRRYTTWYEPFDDQRHITAAIAWLLNGHPEVTGLATAGETRLLRRVITAERERAEVSVEDAEALLGRLPESDYSSPFVGAWA
jgi:aryl-alcohol dehydrogenase-like predicted oxidoreductase